MQIGVVFPQTEIGARRRRVRGVRAAGRAARLHAPARRTTTCSAPTPRCTRPWPARTTSTRRSTSRSCCSATSPRITRLELVTGIIILPQRQTALVAKQAAEVDLLDRRPVPARRRRSAGTPVEYEALGQRLQRPRRAHATSRSTLLRRLWTERVGDLRRRRYEHVTGAGIAPLPVQRPIPIWFGAASPPAYRRIGRLADGWFPMVPPGPTPRRGAGDRRGRARARRAATPSPIGMEGRVSWSPRAASTRSSITSGAGATQVRRTCRSTR